MWTLTPDYLRSFWIESQSFQPINVPGLSDLGLGSCIGVEPIEFLEEPNRHDRPHRCCHRFQALLTLVMGCLVAEDESPADELRSR